MHRCRRDALIVTKPALATESCIGKSLSANRASA
jgi:hypothetical protein